MDIDKTGWFFPPYTGALRYHYSKDGARTLCRKYGTFGATTLDFVPDSYRPALVCATCLKKLEQKFT